MNNNLKIKGYQNEILQYLFENNFYKEELINNIKMYILSNWDKIINDENINFEIMIRLPKEDYKEKDIDEFIDYLLDSIINDNFINNVLIEEFLQNREKFKDFLKKNLKIIKF